MSSEIRQRRVTGLLYEELSILIGGGLDDPKLSLVSVTDVVVSKDLKNVRVFVNHQDEDVDKREVLARLNKALPWIRAQVAERLSTRVVPEITFAYDESHVRASRLDEIFRQIKAEEAAQTTNAGDAATVNKTSGTDQSATFMADSSQADGANA